MNSIVKHLSLLPGALIDGVYLNNWLLFLFTFSMLLFYLFLKNRNTHYLRAMLFIFVLLLIGNLKDCYRVNFRNETTFINHPQLHAIEILKGRNALILVDKLPSEYCYRHFLQPTLAEENVLKIYLVIAF